MIHVTPIILCGGTGTRLWPLSRSGFPKQFLRLTGAESLFQLTAKRVSNFKGVNISLNPLLIISAEEQRFLVVDQLRECAIDWDMALLEPFGRNTAPALTLAAIKSLESGPDPILVVTPSDQIIGNQALFDNALNSAIVEASLGNIVVLGVPPDKPNSGYGYIKVEESDPKNVTIFNVSQFTEKPDKTTAQQYLNEGGYFWNAGIFVLKASVWMAILELFRSDISKATQVAWTNRVTDSKNRFIRFQSNDFGLIASESIDYAVIEKLTKFKSVLPSNSLLKMVLLDADWSDLGSWDAVWDVSPKDSDGNVYVGDVVARAGSNNLVYSSSRMVSLIGVKNLTVIETPDAILVADKFYSQEVKTIVNQLELSKREEHLSHRKVYRPWGWYDNLDEGENFKVKRIQVNPKSSLSLQKHNHRAEHWVVVRGVAEITNGEKITTLSQNESTYIPQGALHRLSNPGDVPLEIIEVQSGSYLGEDDIIRFEDKYGRK